MGIPADSAQMKAMEQKVYDRVATGVVGELMRGNKYEEAATFLEQISGTVDGKVTERLQGSLDANRDRATVIELSRSIRTQGIVRAESNLGRYGEEATEDSAPPRTLRAALERADGIEDVTMRRMVQSQLRTEYAQDEALVNEEYRVQLDNVEQFLAVPGNDVGGVDPVVGRAEADRSRAAPAGQGRRNDEAVLNDVYTDPKKLTPEFLSQNWRRLTPETYRKLADSLGKPAAILDATVDAQQINRTLDRQRTRSASSTRAAARKA
jgi:hypothetical protein